MLKDWALTFLKNRDVVQRRISKLEEFDDHILITNKDSTSVVVIIKETVRDMRKVLDNLLALQKRHRADRLILVLFNQKQNLEMVLKEWKQLAAIPGLSIIFANPRNNSKWILSPHIHNKIADPKSLRQGLVSMLQEVGEYQSRKR